MANAYERKKQPDLVRRRLLEHGARLCCEQGASAFTLQAVAEAAGVTKGGLLHHFRSKQELVEAIFDDLLEACDASIEQAMAADPEPTGRFTRAYVRTVLDLVETGRSGPWAALAMPMITDAGLRRQWAGWLEERLERHRATDAAPALEIARLAADGLWLADLIGAEATYGTRAALGRQLIEMTGISPK